MRRLQLAWLFVLALGPLVAGCGNGDTAPSPPRGPLLVLAAADLRPAFEELEPAFESTCGCEITLTFGSSGNFTSQIEQGIPADVFFSANAGFIDRLESEGLIVDGSSRLYAVGRIVLARPAGRAYALGTLSDLTGDQIRRVSIANPEHAPYGLAAKQALESSGLWAAVRPKLVLGENASQASAFVETGDADAGIIPLSLAIARPDKMTYVLVDEALHAPLHQGAAVLKTSQQPALAQLLIGYITGQEGQAVMGRLGFAPPPGEGGR